MNEECKPNTYYVDSRLTQPSFKDNSVLYWICTVQSNVPMPKKLRCLSASDLFQVIDLDSTSQDDHMTPTLPAALNDVKISALNN